MARPYTTPRLRKPKVTYRQEEGDDGYCYCVRVDGRAVTYPSLTRSEAMYEKARILAAWAAAHPSTEN
jgi:hypothetical protein